MKGSPAAQIALLRLFIRQDLNQRFAGNAVGVVWALILPLLQLALFGLLFVQIFKARVPGLEGVGYLAFIALGMWPWFAFSEAVARGASALVDNAGLLGKVAIAHWQLILARVLVAFAIHGIGFALVLLALGLQQVPLHWSQLPLAALAWLSLLPLAVGVATILALLQVFVRDLVQITPYLLTALMFCSPVLYSASMAPAALQPWFEANPIGSAVSTVRESLLRGAPADGGAVAILLALVLLAVAALIYRRLRPHVEDFL